MTGKKKLHKGDKVSWRSHGGEARGEVEREITERTEAAGRTVAGHRTSRSTRYAARSPGAGPCTSPRRSRRRTEPLSGEGDEQIRSLFRDLVNLSPAELER